MNILDVNKSAPAHKARKRVGRGNASGQGSTAGRGHKGHGQKGTKSMMNYLGGQMSVVRTTPKRGFNNAEFRVEYAPLNLSTLERVFDSGATVDPATVKEHGLVKSACKLKVLGGGELTKKLTVKAHGFSKSAIAKIEKAGGKAEVIK